MAAHNQLGAQGEEMAKQWLQEQGFTLLDFNWRIGRFEIDIICLKENKLHFVEVKCRKGTWMGLPESRVNRKKLNNLRSAGAAYLRQKKLRIWVSYDILSITVFSKEKTEYFLIEDVY
ncbi:MAG: YraN family protein [Bacteroidetes bacterium]|nr:YraN family protein [Bacteroidota bacterium]